MKLAKKIGLALILGGLLYSGYVMAAAPVDKYGTKATMDKSGGTLPQTIAGVNVTDRDASTKLVGAVVSIALEVMGIVFFIIIFYAGFTWMTARGNAEKIDKSKDAILDAAIGLIVVMAAYAITNFVFSSLSEAPAAVDSACADPNTCVAEADCQAIDRTSGTCSTAGYVCCK